MKHKSIAILGAGQMGGGIAQVCATAGMRVELFDCAPPQTTAAIAAIESRLTRAQEKDPAAPAAAVAANITPRDSLGDWLGGVDTIIEAIVESAEIKIALWQRVEPLADKRALLASNTSSCSITELAAALHLPQRFVGVHFMNPAPRMRLVEIIAGTQTAPDALAAAESLAHALGKDTVRAKDSPGFLTNRILMPMINEAIYALHTKVGGEEDIDRAMTLGMHHPMGPLALADFIGLDTCLAVLRVMHDGLGDDKFTPCPLLSQMVDAGNLGRKSGRGFYDYSQPL